MLPSFQLNLIPAKLSSSNFFTANNKLWEKMSGGNKLEEISKQNLKDCQNKDCLKYLSQKSQYIVYGGTKTLKKKNALKIYLSFQQETFGFLTKSEKKIKFLFAKTLQTHQKKLLIYSS